MGANTKFITDPRDPALQNFPMFGQVQNMVFGGPRKTAAETKLPLPPPPLPPDLADMAIKNYSTFKMGGSRKASFLTSGLGETPLERKSLMGR